MQLNFHWINILILFGALQGLIFAVVLFFNKKHPGARFLSAFIFILAYNGFETFSWSSGLGDRFHVFEFLAFITIFGLGPSFYLYIRSLVYPDGDISRRALWAHYSPVLFQFMSRIVIIVYHVLWINKIITTNLSSLALVDLIWPYYEPLSVLIFAAYVIAAIRTFRRARRGPAIRSISKEGQQTIYTWAKALIYCMIAMAVLWPITIAVPHIAEGLDSAHYYPIELLLVLFIYWIAMMGFHRTKVIYLKAHASVLPASETEKHLEQLRVAMERDKLYLDPGLNLAKLADHTDIGAKTISAVLNRSLQKSFNDYVNEYRVREAQERLLLPANRQLTISGIALDSGFNSQATFQRAFKNKTGMTPREFVVRAEDTKVRIGT